MFAWSLSASVFAHAFAIVAVVYVQNARPDQDVIRSVPVELVRLGKPRDPKLLPRIQRPPPPPKAEDAVALDSAESPPKKPETAPKPTPKKSLKLSQAAEKFLAEADLDQAFERIEDREGDARGSVEGTAVRADNIAQGYLAEITQTLKAQYRLPETIPASERHFLTARVVLKIRRDGQILSHEILEIHPNPQFREALVGLLNTITLPPPPESLRKTLGTVGVEVVFKP
jgi:outer membrane biosynthesis protein TonB